MKASRSALLALVSAMLAGCFLFPREEEKLAPPLMEPPQISYETYEAVRGTIVDDFTVSAVFAYTQQQSLSFRSRGGRIRAIPVRSGDRVKAGQLVAELDTDELQFQVALQEISLSKAQLRVEQAKLLGRDRIEQQLAALDVKEAEIVLAHSQAGARRGAPARAHRRRRRLPRGPPRRGRRRGLADRPPRGRRARHRPRLHRRTAGELRLRRGRRGYLA